MIIKKDNLPNGWQWVTLDEVCRDISDGTHFTPTYVDEGVPFLSVKDVREIGISFDNCRFITEKQHRELCKRCRPVKGDVLYTKVGTTGIAKAVDVEREFSIFVSVALLKLTSKVIPEYMEKVLNAPICRVQSAELTQGAANRNLVIQDIKRIVIPLPPIEEQNQIAAITQKADRIRRIRRYALQLSDTYLRSVFLDIFGDFLQKNTKNKFKDVLEIPLSNGVFETNENYGCGTPVIWVDNLYHTISIDTSRLRKAKLDNHSIQKYEVLEGDLLFTRSSLVREGTGQINIVPKLSERTTFECHTIRARINKQLVNPYYILGLYRSSYGRNLIMQRANTATMTTIGQEGIEELLCPIPPLLLQEKFAQIVQKFERLRTQQREAERQAEHLFQTLLHRAFRGELTSQDADDEPESVLLEEIRAHQAKAEATTATQARGEAADYLGTKAKQQDIEPIQLKFPGFE